jgi:hypothetical protein
MKISGDELGKIAQTILDLLEKEGISSISSLEARISRKTNTIVNSSDRISFELRPSVDKTQAYTLSYTREGTGIPIEIRINPAKGYTKIILKTEKELKGYEPFLYDIFDNIVQERRIQETGISQIKAELRQLAISG